MSGATDIIFQIAVLVMSVVIHEVSHGVAAYLQGDKTAAYAGRLTLNPIAHLDPFGSVLLPLLLVVTGSPFLIGWAKPVPYNPYNLRNQKYGPGIVGAAGPLSNLLLAVVFGFLVRFGVGTLPPEFIQISIIITITNIVLALFNLVPIPPLDGSKVLFALLPGRFWQVERSLEAFGIVALLIFIIFFGGIVSVASSALFSLITGLSF